MAHKNLFSAHAHYEKSRNLVSKMIISVFIHIDLLTFVTQNLTFLNVHIFIKNLSNNQFNHSKSIRKCQRIKKSY